MSHPSPDECEKCGEHKAWEERMKLLDVIPNLLTWSNQVKGGMKVLIWLIGLGLPIIVSLIAAVWLALNSRIDKHEIIIDTRNDKILSKLSTIEQSTAATNADVRWVTNELKDLKTIAANNPRK